MLRRLTAVVTTAAAAAAVLLAGGGTAVATASPRVTPGPATCSGVLRIDGFAFDPAQVSAGGSSGATLKVKNCTGLSQAVGETWIGRFSSASTQGIPPGCPVYDPLPRAVTLAPYASVSTTTSYLTFAGCTADRLTVTVTLSQNGVQLGQSSAVLSIL